MEPLRRWEVLISGTLRYLYADHFDMNVEAETCTFYTRNLDGGPDRIVAQFDMCVVHGVIDTAAMIGTPPRPIRADDARRRAQIGRAHV